MLRTSNPVLSEKALRSGASAVVTEAMTVEGAVNRSLISVVLTMGAAYWSYSTPSLASMTMIFVIAGLVCAIVLSFKHSLAPLLTPVYAVVEGMALGSISLFADTQFPGIAFQAISLTFGVMFVMLIAYQTGFIKVTEKLRSTVMIATVAIFAVYLINFIASFFGASMSFLHDSSPLSIGISVVVVGVAAFNLLLDFELIQRLGNQGNQPKYMEWYGAFALLVTLVWLYMEMLRLLMKLQSRD
ncbi:MAG: Bax inhibitor-1/YccA family protein [Bdellovibrionales bacterium]|nr:Bax inhibitor-1/YccA family protein [Bdellovibrionales bacterium]